MSAPHNAWRLRVILCSVGNAVVVQADDHSCLSLAWLVGSCRLRIAVDLARAVTYTHGKEQDDGPTRKRPPFFHRNIMSAFIGLDTAVPLTAKLLNFSSAVRALPAPLSPYHPSGSEE